VRSSRSCVRRAAELPCRTKWRNRKRLIDIMAVSAIEKNAETSIKRASASRCAHKGRMDIGGIVTTRRRRRQRRPLLAPDRGFPREWFAGRIRFKLRWMPAPREKSGRGERIRTSDSCVPNAVLYQTELHPEYPGCSASRARRTSRIQKLLSTANRDNCSRDWRYFESGMHASAASAAAASPRATRIT
jgi:hypothetical protein